MLQGVQTAGQFVAQRQQANAVLDQASFEQKLAGLNAADAVTRGDVAANRLESQTRVLVGTQRATLAAQGVDVASGSAVDLQSQTAGFGALDAQTIRNNAAREALGYTTNAQMGMTAARATASQIRQDSVNTLLTGAAKTYGILKQANSKAASKLGTSVPTVPSAPWDLG
jgi:hypothetical protein